MLLARKLVEALDLPPFAGLVFAETPKRRDMHGCVGCVVQQESPQSNYTIMALIAVNGNATNATIRRIPTQIVSGG
jgi:hypothetical protein